MLIINCIMNGFSSLLKNKLRSFLTMLGIIIGVSSVIVLTSIGEGIKNKVSSQVESLGSNLLYVLPGNIATNSSDSSESRLSISKDIFSSVKSPFFYQDVLDLKGRDQLMAVTGIFNGIDMLDKLNVSVSTTGVDEDYLKTTNMEMENGNFILKEDINSKSLVAVIGQQVKKELFGNENPIGKTFKLSGKDYTVIGLLKYKKIENMGPGQEDVNIKIFLPITEMINRFKDKNIGRIVVRAFSSEAVTKAEQVVQISLLSKYSDNQFSILKQQDMINTVSDIMNMLSAALGGIAGISLLVGGVGIMNIMLVSVMERTREIGIRKAVGAKRLHILIQFLSESISLSLVGASIGLLLGVIFSRIIPYVSPSIPTKISTIAALVSILFSLAIGVFFGVYPASKAAKLNPVEALRNE